MNDKELLMLAAKAAGIVSGYYGAQFTDIGVFLIPFAEMSPDDDFDLKYECAYGEPIKPVKWNPLTDDGDALRLAAKLKFDVMTRWGEAYSAVLDRDGVFTIQLDTDLDMCAATRRAIVRAAAEIGAKL